MTITYRTDGPWGLGKGGPLTGAEYDATIYHLLQLIGAISGGGSGSDNPVVDVAASGSTLTIYYLDGSTATRVVSAPFAPPTVPITGTDTAIIAGTAGSYHRCTNAAGCSVTVPASTGLALNSEWHFRQGPGCPSITFVESGGATINPVDGFAFGTDTEGATCTLKLVGTNEYDLFGLLAVGSA